MARGQMKKCMAYTLGCHPSQDASGHKWRFRLGFPTRNITTILVSWAGGTYTNLFQTNCEEFHGFIWPSKSDPGFISPPGSWISLKRWISRLSAGVFELLEFAPWWFFHRLRFWLNSKVLGGPPFKLGMLKNFEDIQKHFGRLSF